MSAVSGPLRPYAGAVSVQAQAAPGGGNRELPGRRCSKGEPTEERQKTQAHHFSTILLAQMGRAFSKWDSGGRPPTDCQTGARGRAHREAGWDDNFPSATIHTPGLAGQCIAREERRMAQ